MHPLVSPLAAKDWSNSPPLYFTVGEEMLRDEDMPHCFAMLLENCTSSPVHHAEIGKFCRQVVEGGAGGVETNGVFIKAKSLERSDIDVASGLTDIRDEEVEGHMVKGKERIERKFRKGEDPGTDMRPML
jgi:hypothetical protein